MEVNKPGGPVAPTAPVHFFQSLLETDKRFKEKRRKKKTGRRREKVGERKTEQEVNWRRLKKFREI